MTSTISVVYCFDADSSNYAAVSITSLITNSKSELDIHCIVPSSDIDKLPALHQVADRFDIKISIAGADLASFSKWKQIPHFSHTAYLKLLIPDIVKAKKAIYVDTDTLILRDLSELYETRLGNFNLAGIADPDNAFTSKVPRKPNDVYINCGVLLMNLEGLRQDNLFKKCKIIYSQFHDSLTWPDQCLINKYAENKKVILDEKWNRQISPNAVKYQDWKNFLSDDNTGIVHFAGNIKPWMEWCNPYISETWWLYAHKSRVENLKPQQIGKIDHAIALAQVHDLNENFKRASELKNEIIKSLLTHLKKKKVE